MRAFLLRIFPEKPANLRTWRYPRNVFLFEKTVNGEKTKK